jgi:hypothetical protein
MSEDELFKSMSGLFAQLREIDERDAEQRAGIKAHADLLSRRLSQLSDNLIKSRLELFGQFMDAGRRRQELRPWIKAHPDLLDPRLDQPLKDWLRSVEEAEETGAADALSAYMSLRKSCRDFGVDAVFDAQAWEDEEDQKARTLQLMRSEIQDARTAYSRTRSPQALENVVRITDRAQRAAEEAGAPWLIRTQFTVDRSVSHLRWYRVKHERADSETALAALDTITGQLPRTSGLRLTCLINAGLGWLDRAVHEESQALLDQAAKRYGQVMSDYQGTGRTDSEVISALGILARLQWNRYRITGDIRDLREAGRAREAWLAFRPTFDPKEDIWEAQLAAALARQGGGS